MNEVPSLDQPLGNESHPLTSLALLAPVAGMILGVVTTFLLGIAQAAYGNLIVNLFLLAACIVPLRALHLSPRALGLRLIKPRLRRHAFLSLLVLCLYVAFYLFVIRIAALRPFTPTLLWGLLTTFVVAFAEEFYFRGILFSAIQDRFSPRVALVATAILFGLFHARRGPIVMLARTFTGWLWGSVRYASGMIFLLIFPVHVAFNAVWLLFQGNWSNPPVWATVALPAVEFLLGLTIVLVSDKFHRVDERQR